MATARQTSNGSGPTSDWDQGYGYQFWRCRHGLYRGDGAFGQFCIVMPEQDAVVAITSGVRSMQAVMNLVWDKILPALQAAPLPADPAAERMLQERLAGLVLRPVTGSATSSQEAAASGRRFVFPANDRKIETVTLESGADGTTVVVRDDRGEHRIACARDGGRRKGAAAFADGMDRRMEIPADHRIAASGAWTAEDTFTLRVCHYETPFYVTWRLKFAGGQVVLETEYNAAFGPVKPPPLTGRAE